jgi:hypothetical protein
VAAAMMAAERARPAAVLAMAIRDCSIRRQLPMIMDVCSSAMAMVRN